MKKKWYQGWKLVVGSIIGGATAMASVLPPIVIGSINGQPVTLIALMAGLAIALGGTGLAGKIERNTTINEKIVNKLN